MPRSPGREAVEALITEANAALQDGRSRQAREAAEGAVRAAESIGDAYALVRALNCERRTLWKLGDCEGAMASDTKILTMASDSATCDEMACPPADWYVAKSYANWVEAALKQTGVQYRALLDVLDDAERWLAAIGRSDWRAGILYERAKVHGYLGDYDKAIGYAEESLKEWSSDAPCHSIGDHQIALAWRLFDACRESDAAAHWEAVLDDGSSTGYERECSFRGLALCALDAGRAEDALRYATQAMRLAEAIDDKLEICGVMHTLVRAHLATGDLDESWRVAARYLDTARRDGHDRALYYAELTVVDLALDRGDFATASGLMDKLKEHGLAIDQAEGQTRKAVEVARRYRRLANGR